MRDKLILSASALSVLALLWLIWSVPPQLGLPSIHDLFSYGPSFWPELF